MLDALYFSGAHWMMRPLFGGAGAILMLHHVRPSRSGGFQPNRLLEVTPKFFERVVKRLRKSKVDIISLDEMHRRLVAREFPRRFVCITFDDGYKDNHEFAYPILKKYEAPFAIYVATSFADRVGELWWLALEAVIAQNELIGIRIEDRDRWFEARSVPEKRAVYDHIYAWLREQPTEQTLRRVVRELTTRHRVDMGALCRELCMDWQRACDARRRSAGDDRRPHGQPSDPDQGRRQDRARRTGKQPRRDRGGARRSPAASGLSGRRPQRSRSRASSRSRRISASAPR